jgi:DNA-binding response OmpR family regulator
MRDAIAHEVVDLVLLDLKLPSEDGMTLARELRETSNVPIIILTGRKDDVDRIMGLELGADDYLTKPFNLRELLARIRAILRRTQAHPVPHLKVAPLAFRVGTRPAFASANIERRRTRRTDSCGIFARRFPSGA